MRHRVVDAPALCYAAKPRPRRKAVQHWVGERERLLYPNPAPDNPSDLAARADVQLLRTLKVEHLDGTPRSPSGKALLRLKGKWLAGIFAPDTRVSVQVEPGRIVIQRVP